MKLFKNLFNKKEKPVEVPTVIPPPLYTLGWQIKLKDGHSTLVEWQRIPKEEVKEVESLINNQVKEMHTSLEEAIRDNKEFVNLNNNLFRVSDVDRITSHSYKI